MKTYCEVFNVNIWVCSTLKKKGLFWVGSKRTNPTMGQINPDPTMGSDTPTFMVNYNSTVEFVPF